MFKSLRQDIGISLVFVGVTLSMFLNYFYPVTYWTPIIMLLSCLLLCDSSTLRSRIVWNHTFKMIVAFQIIMLFYFVVSFNEELAHQIKTKLLSFHIYVLALSLILMKTQSIRERDFLPCLFVMSGLLTIISSICHLGGIIELDRMYNKENSILEVFTCNIAAFANFSSALLLLSRFKKKFLLLFLVFSFLDFYVIMMSAKRSYFVSALVVAVLYLYKIKQLKKGIIYAGVLYLLLVMILPQVRELTMTFIDRTLDGFSTVFIEKKSQYVDWDDSASIRAWSQRIAVEKLNDFNFFNYLFGGGYYHWFFDNPLGESYLDMGLIGLFFFAYLVIYIPVKTYRYCSCKEYKLLFCIFISSMNISIVLTNNDPYNYIEYTPICMLAMCSMLNINNKKQILYNGSQK